MKIEEELERLAEIRSILKSLEWEAHERKVWPEGATPATKSVKLEIRTQSKISDDRLPKLQLSESEREGFNHRFRSLWINYQLEDGHVVCRGKAAEKLNRLLKSGFSAADIRH